MSDRVFELMLMIFAVIFIYVGCVFVHNLDKFMGWFCFITSVSCAVSSYIVRMNRFNYDRRNKQ